MSAPRTMSGIGRQWARLGWTGLLALTVLTGCDSGSSGPGEWSVSLEAVGGTSPGSALVMVQGAGVLRVEGTGGTRSWSSAGGGGSSSLRVLLMDPDPEGAMTFVVDVSDTGAPHPTVTVLQAAGRDDAVLPGSTQYDIRFDR